MEASRTPFYLDHMREAIDRATAYDRALRLR
jgi:hypothetical protein